MSPETKNSLEYMLRTTFNHIPAGTRERGSFAGEEYDELWWRDCVLEDGYPEGTQGYLIAWFDGEEFSTFHTYRYPPEIYR